MRTRRSVPRCGLPDTSTDCGQIVGGVRGGARLRRCMHHQPGGGAPLRRPQRSFGPQLHSFLAAPARHAALPAHAAHLGGAKAVESVEHAPHRVAVAPDARGQLAV